MEVVPHVTGVRRLEWDPADRASVNLVAAEFAQLTAPARFGGAGYLGYRQDGTNAEQIREFDANASHIVVTAPLVGG